MASLLEMHFASEGEEDDTDYEESSSSEPDSHSVSSSCSSEEEGDVKQKRRRLCRRDYFGSTQSPQGLRMTSSAAAHAPCPPAGAATEAASFSSGQLAGRAGLCAAAAAVREAAGTAGDALAPVGRAAAAPSAVATAVAEDVLTGKEEDREHEDGELQLHGRKKVFSARQRGGEGGRHARGREHSSSQHKQRQAERLKACETFKKMQEAERQALRNYPSSVDPDDFLLQFQRRYPSDSGASTKSWRHLQHHLSIAVSALRRPRSSPAAGAAVQQQQRPPASSPPVSSCDAASAGPLASAGAAPAGVSSGSASAADVSTEHGPASAAAAVPSVSHSDEVSSERQQLPRATCSSSPAQRPGSAASAAGGPLLSAPAATQQPAPTGARLDPTEAATVAHGDSGGAAASFKQTQEVNVRTSELPLAAAGGAAADDAAACGGPAAAGDAADGAAAGTAAGCAAAGGVQGVQQQQQHSPDGEAPLAGAVVAKDAAAAALGPGAAAPSSSIGEQQCSPAAATDASEFSIRECKERCRKKLSKATLVKMMQEALHNMENAGEVSVKKVVRFAGQVIEVEERMEAASARYQKMLELRRRVPQHIGGRFAGLDGLVAALDGPSSINSVQKSQADWEVYKREKGLAAELAKGHGFLQKQAFLAQTEWKQHEQNVEVRRKRQAEHRWAAH